VLLKVMERCGDLNQTLQECPVRFGGSQPHIFPCLVRSKKLAGLIPAQTLGKLTLLPIKLDQPDRHRYLSAAAIDRSTGRIGARRPRVSVCL
jgi:hypothetical protein